MKVLLIHYYCGYIDGIFTSIVDTYYNLLKYNIDVELKIISYDNIAKTIKHLIDNFGTHDLLHLTKETEFESDIIICSSCLIYNNFYVPLSSLNINANKIIILDSADIFLSKHKINTRYNIIPPLNECINKDCILLSNPAGFESCSFPTYEYYHKFSNERLDNPIHIKNILKNRETFNYSRETKRSDFLNETNGYAENIGKSIFERLYYGVKVNYSSEHHLEDGLNYYLKLFGVDSTKNYQPLPISKNDILDKLFMKDNDLLLDMIKDDQ